MRIPSWRVLVLAVGCVAVAFELLGGDTSAVDATAILTVAGVIAVGSGPAHA